MMAEVSNNPQVYFCNAILEILVPSSPATAIYSLSKLLRSEALRITFRNARMIPQTLAAIKYHSHLITCFPCHPGEFLAKAREIHNVLSL